MLSRRLSRLAKLSALTLPLTLSACQTTTGSGGTDAPFCGAARPIYWSTKDTSTTVVQVKEHNAVGRTLCGWGPKA